MRVELKNVKYAAFASEETSCFEATIYVDGKREGTARNDGHGGMTFIEPRALQERLDAYAATLPEQDLGHGLGKVKQTGETLVDDLLTEHLVAQDLKRLLRTRIVTVGHDGKVYQTSAGRKASLEATLGRIRAMPSAEALEHFKADYILNLCTFDEALRLFRAHAQ